MDEFLEDERRRYEICRAGFGILSGALVIVVFETFVTLVPLIFLGRQMPAWLHDSAFWNWIDAPVVWGTLIGSYLLWGRWDEPGWQRRSGFVLVMVMVDVLLWIVKHGQDFGLTQDLGGQEWLTSNVGLALGWAELALWSSLACGMLTHLEVTQATEAGRSTRSLVATGASLFLVLFCVQTDWARGWPLQFRFVKDPVLLLLRYALLMISTIVLIQVTALTVAATRQLSEMVRQLTESNASHDPWGSPNA